MRHLAMMNNLPKIVEPLLVWYDAHARILPWRENPSPYRVWISEIMLQQTRVDTVKPYFERFVAELPTVESLAEVQEERLLKLWEGLGYYNRARNLRKAAQMIVSRYQGEFPSTREELLVLPGIGEYTAGAIASIAFGRKESAVDGNVLRVICRLTENYGDVTAPALKDTIAGALRAIYPDGRCGDFTQSLMELGATVCVPNGAPACQKCPLSFCCQACLHGTTGELPVKKSQKPRRIERKTVLLLLHGNTIAVRQREKKGLLAGLWELPNVENNLTAGEVTAWLDFRNIEAVSIAPHIDAGHIFTHLEWRMTSYIVVCASSSLEYDWLSPDEMNEKIALPSAFKPFLEKLPSYGATF